MTTSKNDIVKMISNAPSGGRTCAIFDFDGTIIAGYSATTFLKAQISKGDISVYDLVEMLMVIAQMVAGRVGFSGMMSTAAQLMRGVSENSYMELGEELFENQIRGKIYPEVKAIIKAHRAKGHTIAIVSSATPYQVLPAATELGIDHVMCSEYEVEDGKFTGGIKRPLCYGEGKVIAAEKLAKELDFDLDNSFFYSDSHEDIELLERVGFPQAMNPNKKLTQIAERRGWPIRRYHSRGRPRLSERLRSMAATSSLVTSFVAGLPILGLTGSRREAVNFSMARFGDLASALIGLRLNVRNEHFLWSNRPCVFIFNHQSGADLVILARLLRRDMVGVGKKELAKIPLIGPVIQYAGTVLIDRENSKSAIEAMAPLVEQVKKDKICPCIAPEGTRSHSEKLGPFKKGAFHIAMQAGVPIVPIVIHNASDVLAKGDKVFRAATVDIDVLEPISVEGWTPRNLAARVEEVRNRFLQTLGQPLKPASGTVAKPGATRKRAISSGHTKKAATKSS